MDVRDGENEGRLRGRTSTAEAINQNLLTHIVSGHCNSRLQKPSTSRQRGGVSMGRNQDKSAIVTRQERMKKPS
ncbi:unnamed protein product [Nezara viridula]|uniref:Uncharacterized protein n=1 Tax=Nezara viridula TaxID=85310 RepID=A0A9P0DYM7_NEZVI|nr:unnamed protein product [Nezara viridula]